MSAMPKVGIVYGSFSKIVRRCIIPDRLEELSDPTLLTQGESILVADVSEHDAYHNAEALAHIVASYHQIPTYLMKDPRCVVINDDGIVVDIILADADIDSHPGGRIVHHRTARHGDKLQRYKKVLP